MAFVPEKMWRLRSSNSCERTQSQPRLHWWTPAIRVAWVPEPNGSQRSRVTGPWMVWTLLLKPDLTASSSREEMSIGFISVNLPPTSVQARRVKRIVCCSVFSCPFSTLNVNLQIWKQQQLSESVAELHRSSLKAEIFCAPRRVILLFFFLPTVQADSER